MSSQHAMQLLTKSQHKATVTHQNKVILCSLAILVSPKRYPLAPQLETLTMSKTRVYGVLLQLLKIYTR